MSDEGRGFKMQKELIDDPAASETAADPLPIRDRLTRHDPQWSRPAGGNGSTTGRAAARPYDGPATFHVDSAVYRIPYLRLEQPDSRLFGRSDEHPIVILLERGELPETRTDMGELRLADHQEFAAWWTGFRFEL
jgi:hypothetical protein